MTAVFRLDEAMSESLIEACQDGEQNEWVERLVAERDAKAAILRAFDVPGDLIGDPTLGPPAAEVAARDHGRSIGRAEAADDLRFLAAAREEYDHCAPPRHQGDLAQMGVVERAIYEEHTTAARLARIIDGADDAKGWLPSWRWADWDARATTLSSRAPLADEERAELEQLRATVARCRALATALRADDGGYWVSTAGDDLFEALDQTRARLAAMGAQDGT